MSRSVILAGLMTAGLLLAGCGSSAGGASASPAAKVNGQTIPMSSYNTRVDVLRYETASQGPGNDPCDGGRTFAGLCRQLKQEALDTLVREELVREYARQHGIAVSAADFNRNWTVILKTRFHSDMAVVRAYAKTWHITVADLKAFARQDLLQQQVMYRITAGMPLAAAQVRLAQIVAGNRRELKGILLELKQRKPFLLVAHIEATNGRTVCGQGTAHCGELGWTPAVFVPASEHAVLAAKPGTVVGPISGQSGFVLLRVEGHDPHHPLSPAQQLSMRRLLFVNWLGQQEKHARVQRYVAT